MSSSGSEPNNTNGSDWESSLKEKSETTAKVGISLTGLTTIDIVPISEISPSFEIVNWTKSVPDQLSSGTYEATHSVTSKLNCVGLLKLVNCPYIGGVTKLISSLPVKNMPGSKPKKEISLVSSSGKLIASDKATGSVLVIPEVA